MFDRIHSSRPSRRRFLASASLLAAAVQLGNSSLVGADEHTAATTRASNTPEAMLSDPRVQLTFGDERIILADGLQPSMLCTKSGTLILQSQLSGKPHPQPRIFYPFAL